MPSSDFSRLSHILLFLILPLLSSCLQYPNPLTVSHVSTVIFHSHISIRVLLALIPSLTPPQNLSNKSYTGEHIELQESRYLNKAALKSIALWKKVFRCQHPKFYIMWYVHPTWCKRPTVTIIFTSKDLSPTKSRLSSNYTWKMNLFGYILSHLRRHSLIILIIPVHFPFYN